MVDASSKPNIISDQTRNSAKQAKSHVAVVPKHIRYQLDQVLQYENCLVNLLFNDHCDEEPAGGSMQTIYAEAEQPSGHLAGYRVRLQEVQQRLHLAADTAKVNVKSGVCPSVCPSVCLLNRTRHELRSGFFRL